MFGTNSYKHIVEIYISQSSCTFVYSVGVGRTPAELKKCPLAFLNVSRMIQNKFSLGIFFCAPDSLSANPHQSFQS